MKIIFLDIDGVLNVMRHDRDKYGSLFHNEFVENLKEIIDKTGAKIVLSSSWRFDRLSTLKTMWEERDLPGELIDTTPWPEDLVERGFSDDGQHERGLEIAIWLADNKPDKYVIIDDDVDMLKSQIKNFVRTSDNYEHKEAIEGYGLTKECAEEAINILNKTK